MKVQITLVAQLIELRAEVVIRQESDISMAIAKLIGKFTRNNPNVSLLDSIIRIEPVPDRGH